MFLFPRSKDTLTTLSFFQMELSLSKTSFPTLAVSIVDPLQYIFIYF